MEEIKSLTYRAKEAVVNTLEKAAANPDGMFAVAELGNAYAAIITAEGMQGMSSYGAKLLDEIKDL